MTASKTASYWLEDLDLNGTSTLYGPFAVTSTSDDKPAGVRSLFIDEPATSPDSGSHALEASVSPTRPILAQLTLQGDLASQLAVKISVRNEGWYRLTQPQLVAAGFPADVDARRLQLFVEGRELPLFVMANQSGLFDASSAVEFYGLGSDSPVTDTRVYWLVVGKQPGVRVAQMKAAGPAANPESFLQTIERRERTVYFSALRNGEAENFFGAVITTTPIEQALTLAHLAGSSKPVSLEIALQGVTFTNHRVGVQLNNAEVGELNFTAQEHAVVRFEVLPSLIREGANSVRLESQNGASDISLVDFVRLTYPHTYTADDDQVKLTVTGNQPVTTGGFTSPDIRVFDVTDEGAVQELVGDIVEQKNGYAVTVVPQQAGERRLLMLTQAHLQQPAAIRMNHPSTLHDRTQAADFIILTSAELIPALLPLKALRERQGLKVTIVDIEDVYDEFNFGNKSPQAIRDFLFYASKQWKVAPRYVMFAGDTSYDPKNYLGFGRIDTVPTKLLDTTTMEAASDDWFTDFDGNGIADLAVGRLPVSSSAEASQVVAKIIGYASGSPSKDILLVADQNEGFNFEQTSTSLRALIPFDRRVTQLNRGSLDGETARQQLFDSLNRGPLLVNYTGHGSTTTWNGNLLSSTDTAELENNGQLSIFILMTCLNGFFDEPARDSLAESLLKSPKGGAVAVWASSGMTLPDAQAALNQQLYRLLFSTNARSLPVGEMMRQAKGTVGDRDIRQTWVLFGDPTMQVKR
jgi:hypothetical protein